MKRKIRSKLLIVLDIILINISVVLAYLIRFDFSFNNIPKEFLKDIETIFIAVTIIKII